MTTAAEQRFPRSMRLKRRRLIVPLFERSSPDTRSVAAGSIRILYRFVSHRLSGANSLLQVGFAPGRCRNAVQRNRFRRQMRETWRRHQHLIGMQTFPAAQMLTLMVVARDVRHGERLSYDLLKAMHLLHQSLKETNTWTGIQ